MFEPFTNQNLVCIFTAFLEDNLLTFAEALLITLTLKLMEKERLSRSNQQGHINCINLWHRCENLLTKLVAGLSTNLDFVSFAKSHDTANMLKKVNIYV